MLSKQDHINYWLKTGHESWESAEYSIRGNKNVDALFFYCLSIEKYLKANWVLDNLSNQAPQIHDLRSIYNQTEITLNPELIDFLDTIEKWNLEGQYPDFRFSLHKQATSQYMEHQITRLIELKKCLLERL